MSVSDENFPTRRDIYGGRRIEFVWSAASDAGLKKFIRTLPSGLNLKTRADPPQVVGYPDVTSVINMKAVR